MFKRQREAFIGIEARIVNRLASFGFHSLPHDFAVNRNEQRGHFTVNVAFYTDMGIVTEQRQTSFHWGVV